MFVRKKQPPIKSLIANGTHVQGDVSFTEGLRIDGEIVGDVCASSPDPSILVLSGTGRIEGTVHAAHVIISGIVEGSVHADELLELQPKARIIGDVYYKAIEMHQGAVISGQLYPAASPLLLTDNSTLKLESSAA